MLPIATINGVSMSGKLQPIKEGYEVTKSNLYADATGRSAETGVMLLYPIRTNVYSIQVEYSGTAAQINEIDAVISSALQFSVKFLDGNTYVTKTMYVSDRIKSTKIIKNGIPKVTLSFSFVEI